MEPNLLRAILDSPGDNGPRLAMSDWLEERGENDRAEFIRVQIEIARIREVEERNPSYSRGRGSFLERGGKALLERENVLLERKSNGWLRNGTLWASTAGVAWQYGYTFRRGFMEEVLGPPEAFHEQGRAMVRVHPLQKVTMAGKEPHCIMQVWRWERAEVCDDPWDLPAWLWGAYSVLLWDGMWEGVEFHGHQSKEDAIEAASEAALAWAKVN